MTEHRFSRGNSELDTAKSPHRRSKEISDELSSSPYLPAICISTTDWAFLLQRPQHLMLRYSRLAPVLYVNPPEYPATTAKLAWTDGHIVKGWTSLLDFIKVELRPLSPQLWSLSSAKVFPLERSIPILRFANDVFTKGVVNHTADRLKIGAHILWCYRYDASIFSRSQHERIVVYDCVDDWSAFLQSHGDASERERRLVAMSDIVFTTAQRLYQMKKKVNPHTYLVPNGVDCEHFSKPASGIPPSMKNIPRPIIGFSGAIHFWVDLRLVETIAKRRTEWSFVFVGPIGKKVDIPRLPNMHFLGKVSYDVLPSYVSSFNVCIIPFAHTELTASADPIKLYEYLASGKPIISTDLPEVRKFAHLIGIADGADEFERSIEIALEEDSPDRVRARQAVAAENSWDNRFQMMMNIIQERRETLGI